MKIVIRKFDPATKEQVLVCLLTLKKGTSKERAIELAKEEIKKFEGNAIWEVK